MPSARALSLILFACVAIAITFAFTFVATIAELVAVLALLCLIARRVHAWTRGAHSKPSA